MLRPKTSNRFSNQRRLALMSALSAAAVPFSNAIAQTSNYPELRLRFYNLHTTEHLDTVFWADGKYNLSALAEINNLMRDHRTGEIKKMDQKLMSILYLINQRINNRNPISVISGYRSEETNRKLALINSGVAKNSFHIRGQAIDIRIPGVDTQLIKEAGLRLRVGGVGYYAKSNFAHIDTGPHRHWEG